MYVVREIGGDYESRLRDFWCEVDSRSRFSADFPSGCLVTYRLIPKNRFGKIGGVAVLPNFVCESFVVR